MCVSKEPKSKQTNEDSLYGKGVCSSVSHGAHRHGHWGTSHSPVDKRPLDWPHEAHTTRGEKGSGSTAQAAGAHGDMLMGATMVWLSSSEGAATSDSMEDRP